MKNNIQQAGSLLVLLSLWVTIVAGYCPDQEMLYPCTCTAIKSGISLQCRGPENTARIFSVANNIEPFQNLELVLESLTVKVLPESVQKATALRINNLHIEKISNNTSFQWPKLNDLVIESSTMVEEPWPYLKTATLLKHLKISNVLVPRIGSDFKDGVPSTISYLDIRKTGTTQLMPHCMGHLVKLKYLLMVDMPLKRFPRNALPVEMQRLHTFILGNTQIDHLEAGFFLGMPKLEVLMLNGNQLTTLHSYLFAPVENHITHLLAERNPLICDCNLVWLTKSIQKKESMNVLASCTDPRTKSRKEATTLDEDQYCSSFEVTA